MTGKCDSKRRNVVTINATAEFIETKMCAAHVVTDVVIRLGALSMPRKLLLMRLVFLFYGKEKQIM